MSFADFSILTLPVGAEIVGLAPGAEAKPEVTAALYQAWLDYGILLFRNVESIDRHLAITRCFGELEIHPVENVRYPANPYLIEIGKNPIRYVYNGEDLRVNRIPWHRDTSYTPDICKGAMLRMLEVPEHEGETLLCDTAKAYDGLSAQMKTRLERLEFKASLRNDHREQTRPGKLWDTVQREDGKPVDDKLAALFPPVVHPAVLTHPESGRKCIFLSPTYVDFFLGLDADDSDKLLNDLVDHMLQRAYIYQHKWSVNDAIVWDNRRFMHAAWGNRPDEHRYGLRTTLAGPMHTGRYFDPIAKPPESTIVD